MESFFGQICFGAFVAIFGGGYLAYLYSKKVMDPAREAYDNALEHLRQDPHNPDLRQEALTLGRRYGTINKYIDEARLMNDINAATARAGSEVSIKSQGGQQKRGNPSIEERLARLDDLRAKGIISDAEHLARRQELLNEI